MALPLDDLLTWLAANGYPGALRNYIPPDPDAVIVVTTGPGGPPTTDGGTEHSTLHIYVRAATDEAAEATAIGIHTLIASLRGSLEMGNTRVISIEPASGPPVWLSRDASQRTTYLSMYLVVTPTGAT
jgi:hypothetical protein